MYSNYMFHNLVLFKRNNKLYTNKNLKYAHFHNLSIAKLGRFKTTYAQYSVRWN